MRGLGLLVRPFARFATGAGGAGGTFLFALLREGGLRAMTYFFFFFALSMPLILPAFLEAYSTLLAFSGLP
jgi:hypothetical protein